MARSGRGRRVITVASLLAAGALMNVAVCWGLSLYAAHRQPALVDGGRWLDDPAQLVDVDRMQWFGGMAVWSQYEEPSPNRVRGPSEVVPGWLNPLMHDRIRERADRHSGGMIDMECHGWPALSLWFEFDFSPPRGAPIPFAPAALGGIDLRDASDPRYQLYPYDGPILPYRPIWRGVVLNTAFYSALIAIVALGPRATMRWLRVRGHRCPCCGYSFAGITPSGPCPECGNGGGAGR